MKAHLKKFDGGLVVRVVDLSKNKRDKLAKAIKELLTENGCEKPTVTTFDDPPPQCAPDEKTC